MTLPKLSVGDTVWRATYGQREVITPCPICFGKKEVTLILGNGDQVLLPCDYCAKGYEAPRGFVTDYEFVGEVERCQITRVITMQTAVGEEYQYEQLLSGKYGSSYHALNLTEDTFLTEEEARARCDALAAERQREEETRIDYIKKDKQKSFAWNAGYHLREAERARESVAYHERMARICKARGKEMEGGKEQP